MFCSKCGKENSNDAKFCAGCGQAIASIGAVGGTKQGMQDSTKEQVRATLKENIANGAKVGPDFTCLECGYEGQMIFVKNLKLASLGWMILSLGILIMLIGIGIKIVETHSSMGNGIPFAVGILMIIWSFKIKDKLYKCPNCNKIVTQKFNQNKVAVID